ncbi:MAG: MarC family protein [Candidatus Buchananbacteria bacterium CG10_big_fil_rev_8_21_14_0_10_42_9]|uniref:UPF0056 membrane protein n=1 Tax=Candidatus Buchananbacteria bacterium CG10_big_fil_rev_8_21_14_0_10_42_9 TaxID=1974526 RepID=A0A2H0W196_9BACT|nr:MAG: MarC family protein [Candidatus Buchananbacteria bacterium CG10_big_fil_rev_8_21_14_0_10_42_9]
MLSATIAFLVLLNPFALFLYLEPVWTSLSHENFLFVLFKASLISFLIYALFLFAGNALFQKIFQIHFESFRIFGGIVVFSFAYFFIVKGQKAFVQVKENLDDMASEIALPFMVGPATISLVVLMANDFGLGQGFAMLFTIMAINYLTLVIIKFIRDAITRKKFKIAFDKNMEVLLRLNGFFVGAIGVNMIITGVNNLYF